MPGAKSVPAAPTAYSPVAAPISRSASAAPALRSSLTAPAMLTMAAMLRVSGEKATPATPISTQAPPSESAYATSPGVHAPSIGPSPSESSTLASSLAFGAALPETLAHSESSAGHDSTPTGTVLHAQLQALHLVNAPPVRSSGVDPDVHESSHGGMSQEGASGSCREENLRAWMWDGAAGGLIGGGGSTNAGRKPGDSRMLMPDGSALKILRPS
ncbi:hypothetical protein EV122DRAFT_284777 [Schizophyllum commune]